ncbi:zinc metalloprotease HtpX [Brockia lithotrophica]|uniref:Protease HtpX homolog n=1 Tax=Brockia lithotrophica TaxID=933949 RepID=A0A660L6Z9_9BACL|nr:zinc metalloprotease HtpX [Brockia lithotrophica]RKQ88609.1 heat shock protein [Brockia lithotrophica]
MLYEALEWNRRRTRLILALFVFLVAGAGAAVGYLAGDTWAGLGLALVFAAVYLPLTYATASRQVLALAGAVEASPEEYPELHHVVEELALAARIPKPRVYVVPDEAPNAFAVGIRPEEGAVAFTTGLLKLLNREELEGVAAHEISHLKNGDARLMTLAIALVGVIVLLADIGRQLLWWGGLEDERGRVRRREGDGRGGAEALFLLLAVLFLVLAPLAAQLTQLALSRNREFYADASAVDLTRNPQGLIRALAKLKEHAATVRRANAATAGMYFVRPFADGGGLETLFSTHPPIEERIRRLEAM